ncbi:MAG TPA: SDR family NAD(P)-dependent oxidoreductase [Dehalococcoidia bacterium]|nr:SDR family NAD(P)-dependent oxidoreductase [Dehalococcoidia bacterium]
MTPENRILVTGAAGFIGSHLVQRLRGRGHSLVALDNFDPYYDAASKRRNLEEALAGDWSDFVQADVRDRKLMADLLRKHKVTTVVHLAARAGVRASLEDPQTYFDLNVMGTLALWQACHAAGVKRFLFASSSSVYGQVDTPVTEGSLTRPLSPYGASKAAAESLCQTYAYLSQIDTAVLRFFTVYGPRQRPDMAIRRFINLIDEGRPVTLFGDGHSRRDYTYVDDIIAGVVAAIEKPLSGYHVFNLGGGEPVELERVVRLIEKNLGKRATVRYKPAPPGEPTLTFADISRARQLLGFQPHVSIEQGIERFVRWHMEKVNALAPVS